MNTALENDPKGQAAELARSDQNTFAVRRRGTLRQVRAALPQGESSSAEARVHVWGERHAARPWALAQTILGNAKGWKTESTQRQCPVLTAEGNGCGARARAGASPARRSI